MENDNYYSKLANTYWFMLNSDSPLSREYYNTACLEACISAIREGYRAEEFKNNVSMTDDTKTVTLSWRDKGFIRY